LARDYLGAARIAEAHEAVVRAQVAHRELDAQAGDPAMMGFDLELLELHLRSTDASPELMRESLLPRARFLLAQSHEWGWREDQVQAQLLIGQLAFRSAELDEARCALEAALVLVSAFPMPLRAWRLHVTLAAVLDAQGNGQGAVAARRAGEEVVQSIANGIQENALRCRFWDWQAGMSGQGRKEAAIGGCLARHAQT
jgi:hypothetical protein